MTQYNKVNVNGSNSELLKLKLRINDGTQVTFSLSSDVIDDSNEEIEFSPKFLLTDRQVSRLPEYYANKSSVSMKLSKTLLSKMAQLERFLGILFGTLLKSGLLLMIVVLNSLAKLVLVPVKLTAPASATDAAIQKESLYQEWMRWKSEIKKWKTSRKFNFRKNLVY